MNTERKCVKYKLDLSPFTDLYAKNVTDGNQIRPVGPERLLCDPLAQLTEILFVFTYDRADDKETSVIFYVFICGRICLEVLAGRARPSYRNVIRSGSCLICEISSPGHRKGRSLVNSTS